MYRYGPSAVGAFSDNLHRQGLDGGNVALQFFQLDSGVRVIVSNGINQTVDVLDRIVLWSLACANRSQNLGTSFPSEVKCSSTLGPSYQLRNGLQRGSGESTSEHRRQHICRQFAAIGRSNNCKICRNTSNARTIGPVGIIAPRQKAMAIIAYHCDVEKVRISRSTPYDVGRRLSAAARTDSATANADVARVHDTTGN